LNFFGIETNQNYEKSFNLFMKASKQNHILAQLYVGRCYEDGYGMKNWLLNIMKKRLMKIW